MERPNFMSGENHESDNYDAGFNQCKLEYDTYLSSIADVDDLAINMQTEYNKMTGELLEKDVAVEMATKISDHIKGNK